MIYTISIATERVLDECITQTSHDFQSIKVRGADTVDSVYDDWVMTRYNSVDLYSQLQEYSSDLFNILRTFLVTCSSGQDIIAFSVNVNHPKADIETTLNNSALLFFKYSALAWWYQYRDIELSKIYEVKATKNADKMFTFCMPRTGVIVGRYF